MVIVPLAAVNVIFAPMISEMYGKGQLDRLEVVFKLVTKWIFLTSFPIFLLIVVFSEPILYLFGAEFSAGAPALRILSAGYLIDASVGSVGFLLTMTGRPNVNLINSIVLGIANLALIVFLTPRYGMLGTAVAVGAATAIINLARLGEVYHFLKIHPYRRDFAKPLLSGLIVLFCFLPLSLALTPKNGETMMLQLLLAPPFILGYMVLLRAFKLSDEDEVVVRMIVRKLRAIVNPASR